KVYTGDSPGSHEPGAKSGKPYLPSPSNHRAAKDAGIKQKSVNAYGLKSFKDSLLIPVRDIAGNIHSLQFIAPDGCKVFKTGTNKAGHFFKIGRSKDNTVIICEGYQGVALCTGRM
ncbi:MAG: hypothetical protein WA124_05745, partial [Smithella sp.]